MDKPVEQDIRKIMESWDPQVRDAGLQVRRLIYETANTLPEVGKISETLKWGQPAYLTPATRSGTTIRIDADEKTGQLGIYVHCQTNLVDTFRAHYSDQLEFEKNRAILLDVSKPLPIDALRHCIAMALTYHSSKSAAG